MRRVVQVLCLGAFLALLLRGASVPGAEVSGATEAERQWPPAETFLWLDSLVAVSAAVAARAWTIALWGALGVFVVSLVFPRGFCGYVCPLGTVLDAFDWLSGRRSDWRKRAGRWAFLRFHLLAALLATAASGVLLAGYVSPIPLLTRGLVLSGGRLQIAAVRGWDQVPPASWAAGGAIVLLAATVLLSLLGRRFWCNTLCPSGALLSCFSLARVWERRVSGRCTRCGRCREACSFGAIREDFTTRPLDCASCQVCGGVCPVRAIAFEPRWRRVDRQPAGDPPVARRGLSRRALALSAAGGLAAGAGIRFGGGGRETAGQLLRPPGAVAESRFLGLCVRCGQCVTVCPGPMLHPAGLEGGPEALWTPVAVPSIAPCHQNCNACTQVCSTGAIRPLSLAEKRRTPMGLAVVNSKTCLPHRGELDCTVCFQACEAAEYHAIKFQEIRLAVGDVPEGAVSAMELEAMGRIKAPFVDPDACVGCGQCEYRCGQVNAKGKKLLRESAIVVVAPAAESGRGRR